MINRVILTGRLTKDPELKYTANGVAVVSFTLAVDRQFKSKNGDREADFINCVIWRKQAEAFANYNQKGSMVGIDGRLQVRSYENKQGARVYVTEVVVENFSFLGGSRQDNNQQQTLQNQRGSDPFQDAGQEIDVNDDDVPF